MTPDTADTLSKLGAVVLGFALAQFAEWAKNSKKSRSSRRATKSLVTMETLSNRTLLERYWSALVGTTGNWQSNEGRFSPTLLAKAIIRNPLPNFNFSVWQSCLAAATEVFSETELAKIWEENESLKQLHSIRQSLENNEALSIERGSAAERRSRMGGNVISSMVESLHFSASSKQHVFSFVQLVGAVIGKDAVANLVEVSNDAEQGAPVEAGQAP